MPPRLRVGVRAISVTKNTHAIPSKSCQCRYASAVSATVPAPNPENFAPVQPLQRYPPLQPPSHKRPEFRKSQLHRQYTSLLRSTPLILIFQHSNLTANELMGLRRELTTALRKVDEAEKNWLADSIKIQVIRGSIFSAALRVVEFFKPADGAQTLASAHHPTDPRSNSSAVIPDTTPSAADTKFTHGLSEAAWAASRDKRLKHGLEPLLSGPLLLVTLPAVSPAHLKSVFSILSPSPDFPAPKRRTTPSYHEPAVQAGVQKLMLLGARVEGRVFDFEGVKWVGKIEGGLDGLRASLVHLLSSASANLANTLESASKSLYFTMEGRKTMLEEESKPKEPENP